MRHQALPPASINASLHRVWRWAGLGIGAVVVGLWPVVSVAMAPERVWVSWVIDGDTLVLVPENADTSWTLRLADLDAPERCQPGGVAARQALVVLAHRQWVVAERLTQDVYGRWVGRVWREGEDLGESLVRQGWAWAYGHSPGRGPYARAQAQARRERWGVFAADPTPMAPWVFRRFHGRCPDEAPAGAPVQRWPAQTGQ